MKYRIAPVVMFWSALAFAAGSDEETFVSVACGQSEAAAYHDAEIASNAIRDEEAAKCLDANGVFESRQSRGYCIHNDGDVTCRVECAVYLRTKCETTL